MLLKITFCCLFIRAKQKCCNTYVTVLYCTVPYLSAEKFIRHRSESVNFELDDNECGGKESGK